jgi:hypothetical protein
MMISNGGLRRTSRKAKTDFFRVADSASRTDSDDKDGDLVDVAIEIQGRGRGATDRQGRTKTKGWPGQSDRQRFDPGRMTVMKTKG